jgi:hypothetical protein
MMPKLATVASPQSAMGTMARNAITEVTLSVPASRRCSVYAVSQRHLRLQSQVLAHAVVYRHPVVY